MAKRADKHNFDGATPGYTEKKCSKCKVFPAQAKHPWCLECFAEYQASNREAKIKLAEGSGFAKGVEAMRLTLAMEFFRIGAVPVLGNEVAAAIQQAPAPSFKG